MPVTFAPGPHPSSPPRSSHRRLSPSSPNHPRVMTSLRPTHYVQPPSRRPRTRASFSSDRSDPPSPPDPQPDPAAMLAAVQDPSASATPQETSMHPAARAWADPERLPLLAEANEDLEPPHRSRRAVWHVLAATSIAVLLVTGVVLWATDTLRPWDAQRTAAGSSS